jgi:hypothetical protein
MELLPGRGVIQHLFSFPIPFCVQRTSEEFIMTFTKVLAAAALVTAMATPVFAQEIPYGADGRTGHHTKYTGNYGGYNRGYYNRGGYGYGYAPGEVAAGIVGGAIGTAAAIAGAPVYGDSYAYEPAPVYEQAPSYAVRQNGFVCQPGTVYRNSNGYTQICQ